MDTFAIRNLTFSYPEQPVPALDDFSLTVGQGEFLVLCGPSGCGKSTLLCQLKSVLTPHGTRSGEILFEGTALSMFSQREQSRRIGFVMQCPENQIVTDKVWHELAFGLESLGYDSPSIRRRVAEMASFFGIQSWFSRDVAELSGGQKQLLNLASVMALQPSVLILDEPTSQLDPIAAADFLAVLGKINRELGTTILLTEHRLEDAFPMATTVAVMDRGRLLCAGSPSEVGVCLRDTGHTMFLAMPTAMRVWAAVPNGAPCPVTVREGRDWLTHFAGEHALRPLPDMPEHAHHGETVLTARDLWFKYEKELPDVVKGLSLTVKRGEFLAVLGGNGTGKTTSLKLLGGLLKPYRGEVQTNCRMGVLPQNPQALFVKKTVREDLFEILMERGLTEEIQDSKVARVSALCRLEGLLDRHPYDLSGGEQQRAALAKLLLLEPEILLMDEPTKGFDAEFKQIFAEILQELLHQGVAILMVSHDVEFCASHAMRCVLFFDGNSVTEGTSREFFSGNSFYTTSANRMARSLLPKAVTAEDVIHACGGQARAFSAENAGITTTLSRRDQSSLDTRLQRDTPLLSEGVKRVPLAKRTLAAAALILLFIPLTLFVGVYYLGGNDYYLISLLILLETMVPFFLIFEGRKPQARELVIIALLCAIAVAGRAAFLMLPQFKPVMAITIIAGVAFGGETGFLVGSMTMLASNVLFSQGPWTPWQMFAMGIIGFLAGVLFCKGFLGRSRVPLTVFGAFAAIFIYGGIMNPASALMWLKTLNWKILVAYYATGFPMDCIHAAATALFLWFAAEPMLEKLDRVKMKYGLVGGDMP